MIKTASLLIGAVLIVGVGSFVYWQVSVRSVPAPRAQDNTGEAPQGSAGSITAAEIARHADSASCWSSINGGVYDLTSWIPQHPGGSQAILQLCGKDGSAKFNGQHGGQKLQANILAGFRIGTLTQ